MISKNTSKRLLALSRKKIREQEKLFVVEGDKMVLELAGSGIQIAELFVSHEFEHEYRKSGLKTEKLNLVNRDEIKKISQLKTPQNTLAVCRIPEKTKVPKKLEGSLSLYLDGIQDPGNLGTIVRICDWFGVEYLFCSTDTVDLYNPKVIQASMGSFARVKVVETEFERIKETVRLSGATIYGAFMEGKNVYSSELDSRSVLVMGNEGAGIRAEVEREIDHKISIPNFSAKRQKAESLNVSVATSVLVSEFVRRK